MLYIFTMKFANWFHLKESVKIWHIDPEEDWEEAQEAENIAKIVRIRPDSTKNATIIAKNDQGEVIGAVFASWSNDEDASQYAQEPIAQWNFDVVVHPQWQGYDMVGMKLIRAAEEERKNLEQMNDQKAYTKLWVVNPKLAKILQHPKYGYNAEAEYSDGSAHLVKY